MPQPNKPSKPTEAAGADAAAAARDAAKENVQATSDLTRDLIERNTELAMQMAPAFFEGYERSLRSFASLYEQAGQQMTQAVQAMAQAPRSATEGMTEAAKTLSGIPGSVGQALTQAGEQAAQASSSSGGADLQKSMAALTNAQASFMRDVAETLSMARELVEKQSGADAGGGPSRFTPSGSTPPPRS